MVEDKKVWRYVRGSFAAIIMWWFFVVWLIPDTDNALAAWVIILLGFGVFNFVNCIRHLTIYKQKGYAITSLVLSSLLILVFVVAFIWGALSV